MSLAWLAAATSRDSPSITCMRSSFDLQLWALVVCPAHKGHSQSPQSKWQSVTHQAACQSCDYREGPEKKQGNGGEEMFRSLKDHVWVQTQPAPLSVPCGEQEHPLHSLHLRYLCRCAHGLWNRGSCSDGDWLDCETLGRLVVYTSGYVWDEVFKDN